MVSVYLKPSKSLQLYSFFLFFLFLNVIGEKTFAIYSASLYSFYSRRTSVHGGCSVWIKQINCMDKTNVIISSQIMFKPVTVNVFFHVFYTRQAG